MRYHANVKVTTIKGEMTLAIELHDKHNTEVDAVTIEFVEHIIKKIKPSHWEIINITEGKEAVEALGENSLEKEERLELLRKSYNRE
jgi:hypothetical protein